MIGLAGPRLELGGVFGGSGEGVGGGRSVGRSASLELNLLVYFVLIRRTVRDVEVVRRDIFVRASAHFFFGVARRVVQAIWHGYDDNSGMDSSTPSSAIVYGGAVTRTDLTRWNRDLDELCTRMSRLFYRTESKRHGEQYLRGLLGPLEKKNGWTIAEYVGEPEPKALQRFLNLSPWDVEDLLELNRAYAMEHLACPEGILVADPTGFAKKGTRSVGVQRQYSGTLGRVDNCQIATFLAYVTPGRDRVLIDRALYLPQQSWIQDSARRAQAGVPDRITFRTRPEQVIDMIRAAIRAGVPFAWFTADEEFGQNPGLRQFLEARRLPYVMAVPKNTRLTEASGSTARVEQVATRLGRTAWTRRACGIGAKGYRTYDWALIESDQDAHQYLLRRSIQDGEIAYYHCYNPAGASVCELVHVAGARWPIEECFAAGKNEVGLDDYQVRTWTAWHRHITLSMLAHTFLAVTAHHTKKGGPEDPARPPDPTHPADPINTSVNPARTIAVSSP